MHDPLCNSVYKIRWHETEMQTFTFRLVILIGNSTYECPSACNDAGSWENC